VALGYSPFDGDFIDYDGKSWKWGEPIRGALLPASP
jgi:hypothetical protein